MPAQATTHFFVSYTGADLVWAQWIAWELEANGYKTTLAAWHFRPGQNFIKEMHKAATEADAILAVLSPEYLNAIYTQDEWSVGFVKDTADAKGRLLPVRVKECKPHGLLSNIIYIDLVDLAEEQCRRALRNGLLTTERPQERPIFPGPRSVFPGTLPAVWNIPHNRNLHFIGREDYLADLYKALTLKRGSAWAQAIVGEGGIGKTQIAIEYAYRHQADYKVVWWLRTEALATDYGSLARTLLGPEKEFVDQTLTVQSVREWLGQNTNWLLIFDNAQNQAELRNYFPSEGGGHVLITSRNQNWDDMANVSKVEPLGIDAAANFLLPATEAA
jgi:hypothetical protein